MANTDSSHNCGDFAPGKPARPGARLLEAEAHRHREGVGGEIPRVVAEPDRGLAGHEGIELVAPPVRPVELLEGVLEARGPGLREAPPERRLEAEHRVLDGG